MSKHTPGRWIAFNNGFKIWVKSEDTLKHIGQFVAELTEQVDKEKAWADAQLIAAAPFLLETAYYSLEITRGIIDGIRTADPKMALTLANQLTELERPILEAIAKAEGKP